MGLARQRLLASDPGGERLRASLRALFTAAAGAALLLALARLLQLPSKVALMGVIVPLMSCVSLQDGTPAQQKRSLLLLPLVTIPIVWVGTWTARNPPAAAACFLLVIVGGLLARRRGPRAAGLGALAYQSFFYALLLQLDPGQEGWAAAAIIAGTAIAYAAHLPYAGTPQRLLRGELRAWRARIALLLDALAASLQPGEARALRRARRHLAKLNALSLRIDARLTQFSAAPSQGPGATLRDRVLDGEIAAETLASAAGAAAKAPESSAGLQGALRALRDSVAADRPFQAAEWAAEAAPELPDAGLRWRFRQAARELANEPAWRMAQPPLAPTPQRPAEGSAQRGTRWYALDANTRQACQAAAAAVGASAAGYAIAPDHWFWAVFAAIVVFTRATSLGQALSQAWQGVLANVAGVAVGLLLAEAVHGHVPLQLALLFVFIGAGFYAYRGMQPLYTGLLTAMLAMLYELLGAHTPDLLLTRLEETLAGAAMALAAGLLVFPVRTQAHSDSESAALLREAADVLRGALARPPVRDAREAVRGLDRKLQDLRGTLEPVTQASYPAAKGAYRRRLHQLSVLVYCLRHLAHLAGEYPEDFEDADALRGRAAAVAATLDAAAAALCDGNAHALRTPPAEAAATHQEERRRLAWHWLERIDTIARQLAAETVELAMERNAG